MKTLSSLALAICIIFSACNSNSSGTTNGQVASELDTKQELPTTFYKKLKGAIRDNIAVTMDLQRNDSILSGKYYYDKIGLPLSLYGKINASNELTLTEANANGEEVGKFVGKFTSTQTMEGTWTNLKTKKELSFKLTETNKDVAAISFEHFHKENCDKRNKSLKKFESEWTSWRDTLCSTIEVNLIKVTAANPAASNLINQSIVEKICGKGQSINDYFNSLNQTGQEELEFSAVGLNCFISTNDNNILSISIELITDAGGAHTMNSILRCNYDLITGEEIKLDKLLKANGAEKLNRIGEKIFIAQYGKDFAWDFEKGQFELNDNFSITPGGLLFTFNTYEIGPYGAGAPEVFIPYSAIADLIKSDGVLSRIARK